MAKPRRCAVYTRKSSEEGLEQDFNSLDAQREACEAFIRSQKHEGWILVEDRYDDGGYSGGTMDRPALRRLLTGISEERVHVVVVYKVDRLTRSLADFAKIVEVFDGQGASFVSVTQQFNTTTSMGRLTLNVLLSFAQFEREVTGERIRDKIAASKQKGMWMGGPVPMGYDPVNRRLVVNETEAEVVRLIFQRYLDADSVFALKEDLEARGITSKIRVAATGKRSGGQAWGRGALYRLLQNRVYLGEIVHRDKSYPGQHPAIVDRALWDRVQTKLESHRIERATGNRAQAPSLLAGRVFDHQGQPMAPSHACKGRLRYRYYVTRALTQAQRVTQEGQRIPAPELEAKVVEKLMSWLSGGPSLADSIQGLVPILRQKAILEGAPELVRRWPELSPGQQRGVLLNILERVIVGTDTLELRVWPNRLPEVMLNKSLPPAAPDEPTLSLTLPVQIRRCGFGIKLVVESGRTARRADSRLVNLLVKAKAYRRQLMSGTYESVEQIALKERVTSSYVTRLLRIAFLAPDITKAILEGRQPETVTAQTLAQDSRLPLAWSAQRTGLARIRHEYA